MAATVRSDARVPAATLPPVARALHVEGVVQGVGFRPFVWRLATELGLAGRVRNAAGRVEIEARGTRGGPGRVRAAPAHATPRRAPAWSG